MADAVSRPGKVDAVFFGNRLDELMVVRIFAARLQHIMIDIGERFFRLDPGNPHGFKLQVGHCARGILRQRIIDADGNFFARRHIPGFQVLLQYLIGQCFSHSVAPPFRQIHTNFLMLDFTCKPQKLQETCPTGLPQFMV